MIKEILRASNAIPQTVLDNADCIVILHSAIKASFGLGSSFGRGVITDVVVNRFVVPEAHQP